MAHVVLTGPITGLITLADGREVNVTADQIEVDDADAAEIAHKISMHYYEHGHPNDIEEDDDGNLVQRPFVYDAPDEFKADLKDVTPRGTPRD